VQGLCRQAKARELFSIPQANRWIVRSPKKRTVMRSTAKKKPGLTLTQLGFSVNWLQSLANFREVLVSNLTATVCARDFPQREVPFSPPRCPSSQAHFLPTPRGFLAWGVRSHVELKSSGEEKVRTRDDPPREREEDQDFKGGGGGVDRIYYNKRTVRPVKKFTNGLEIRNNWKK